MRFALVVVGKNLNAVVDDNVIIILRRIVENSTKDDIIEFLGPTIKGKIFQKKGYITHIEIQALLDAQTKEVEVHGLVTIDSDEVAQRVIKKFNRKMFKGKRILIREYFFRSWRNDPRVRAQKTNIFGINKRIANRRRSELEDISGNGIKFIGEKKFHRRFTS